MSASGMRRRPFLTSIARAFFMASAAPGTTLISAAQASDPSPGDPQIQFDDPEGALGRVPGPVCVRVNVATALQQAATQGRLVVRETFTNSARSEPIPVQCVESGAAGEIRLCWLMPAGKSGRRNFKLEITEQSQATTTVQSAGGHYELTEQGRTVLRYNYSTVSPGEVLKSVSEENRKYAVARSDYIHPLYGPDGETLTKDWSVDHPHHRGIYWAWPEVDWRGERADLHALQNVFARPTGKCEAISGPVFAELRAENLWKWKDQIPIVRELARIRAYRADAGNRMVDLELRFEALDEPVRLARRGTDHYGGLNLRFNKIMDQKISHRICPPASSPNIAWADISGTFPRGMGAAGVTIVQHQSNPEYPGEWVQYPELDWLQPTFPTKGTRY